MANAMIEAAVLIAIGVPSFTQLCMVEFPMIRPMIAVAPQPRANHAR